MGRHAAAAPVDAAAGPAGAPAPGLAPRRLVPTGPTTDPLILPESVLVPRSTSRSDAPGRARAMQPPVPAATSRSVLDRSSSPRGLDPKAAVAPAAAPLPRAGQPARHSTPVLDPLHVNVVPRYVAVELSTHPRPSSSSPMAERIEPERGGFAKHPRRSLAVCAAAVLSVLATSSIALADDGGASAPSPRPHGRTVDRSSAAAAPVLQRLADRRLRATASTHSATPLATERPAWLRPSQATTASAAPRVSPAPDGDSTPSADPSSSTTPTASGTPETTASSSAGPTPSASTSLVPPAPTSPEPGDGRFVSGTTRPDASNTGAGVVRQRPTREIWGDVTLRGNESLVDTVVHGRVSVKGDGNLIENCVILGRPGAVYGGSTWLVNTSSARDAVVRFNTIRSTTTSRQINGIGLRNVTAERNDISRVIDGFDIDPGTPGADVATTIKDNYIHDLMFFGPDPGHGVTPTPAWYRGPWRGVGWSHDDAVQVTGGRGLRIIGNRIDARWASDIGTSPLPTYQAELSALMVNSPRGPVTDLLMKDNWIDGGQFAINAGGASGSGTFTGNRFGRNVSGDGDRSFTLVFDRSFDATTSDNVYDDTGAAVLVRRAY